METVNVCQNLWPHLYRKPPKGFPQDVAYMLSRVGRIFWPQKKSWANGRRQNRQNFNVLWFQWNLYLGLFWSEELIGNDENCIQGHFYDATVSKMAANKINKLLMVSDFNENWYLGLFWIEELIGNDEIYIQGHFYEAIILKMVANKILKLSMVSDFNENWCLGVFWSEKLVGALNSDMGVVWGLLCLHPNTIKPSYSYYYSSTHFCPLDFSEMPWSNFMKPCRNIIFDVKLCF